MVADTLLSLLVSMPNVVLTHTRRSSPTRHCTTSHKSPWKIWMLTSKTARS
ncbi:MAG: hypothetical protein ACLT3Y_10795 [Ruminococcus callidus]